MSKVEPMQDPAHRKHIAQSYSPVFKDMQRRYKEFDPLSTELFLNLIRAGDHFRNLVEKRMRIYQLTGPAFGILSLLDSHPQGRLSMNQISRMMLVTQANMTGLIDTIEKQGHVRRVRDEKDRRIFWIEITAAGRKKVHQIRPGHFRFVKNFFKDFNLAQKRELISSFEIIHSATHNWSAQIKEGRHGSTPLTTNG